ncbi:MAG: hypothetical protein AAFV19_18325 [Pseudomonadota bacterium]
MAEAAFADMPDISASTVCAVGVKLAPGRQVEHVFSGRDGYKQVTDRVRTDDSKSETRAAQRRITDTLTSFLTDEDGGGFTPGQVTGREAAYALHERGAMNCAEPKLLYIIRNHLSEDVGNWAVIPFYMEDGTTLMYSPPCRNCRRWVYKTFHSQTQSVATNRGPGDWNDGAIFSD